MTWSSMLKGHAIFLKELELRQVLKSFVLATRTNTQPIKKRDLLKSVFFTDV